MRYLLCGLSLFSLSAVSATLYLPEEIIPLQLNDTKIEHSFFSAVEELELKHGIHKLKLKYSDLYELDYDDHEVVESNPFWVEVSIKEANNYRLMINKPIDAEAAKIFAAQPSVQIINITTTEQTVVAKTNAPNKPKQKIEKLVVNDGKSPKALQMLDFWWQQASKEERQTFLIGIKKD